MAESESSERETDSPESCPELDDEFFNNIGQTFEVLDSWTASDDGNVAEAHEVVPDNPKEESRSGHSRGNKRDRDRSRSNERKSRSPSPYRPSRFSPPGRRRPRPKRPSPPPSKNTSFGVVEAPGPSIMLVGRRMMPVGPKRSPRPNFMNAPNFQPHRNLRPSSAFMTRPNFTQQQQFPSHQFPPINFIQPVGSTRARMMHPNAARVENLRDPRVMRTYPPAPPPPALFKPPEPDEQMNFLEVRRKAFENVNSNFLEDLRRISDQTSKKETEDDAEMKAKLEDERLRAEQAEKAEKYEKLLSDLKNNKWAPIQEPSTGEIRMDPVPGTLMVISPVDYPKSIISTESFKRIEEKLSVAMELHSRFHPGFIIKIKNIEPKQGVIGVTCEDIATANWLKSAVRDLNRHLECKSVEQAQLPPCFMIWVGDPKADFEQVRLVIGQQGICTRYWILLLAYKADINLATPGRKFLFLGDNALKERFQENTTLKVQYKFYRTKAVIRLLKGIGEDNRAPLKDVMERGAINRELDMQRAVEEQLLVQKRIAKGQSQAQNKALAEKYALNAQPTEAPLLGQKRTLPEATNFKNGPCEMCNGCHKSDNCKALNRALNLSNYCKAIPDSTTTSEGAQYSSTKSTVTSQHPVAAKSAIEFDSTNQLTNDVNLDGSLDLAILPATYPEVCISQEVFGNMQRFLTRAKLMETDERVSLTPLTIKSGLLVSHCPNKFSAEWMATMVMSRDWTLQVGAPIQVRPLNDVDVAPTFEMWIPETHNFQQAQRLVREGSQNTIDTSVWRMTKEHKNLLADQRHNGKPKGKKFIFLAGANLLRIAGTSNGFKISYGAYHGRIRVITRGGYNSAITQAKDRARAEEGKRKEEELQAQVNATFNAELLNYFNGNPMAPALRVNATFYED